MKKIFFSAFVAAFILNGCAQQPKQSETSSSMNNEKNKPNLVSKTDEEWKKELSPEEYRVLRAHGTERAFTGEFHDHHEKGVYLCAACGSELFHSETKFDSGTGWPSYYAPVSDSSVAETRDNTLGMTRIEVHCARCGGHLGHVFDDGPQPTGLRYCINSVSLDFKKENDQ